MKLQNGTRVKLKQENNLFHLPSSFLEIKMSSNNVKLGSARKWHRAIGSFESSRCGQAGMHHRQSGNSVMYAMRTKSEALASLKKFFLSVGTPKKLRQDNAKEFLSKQFKKYCLDAGILQENTITETPQQNWLAESCNRTLPEMA